MASIPFIPYTKEQVEEFKRQRNAPPEDKIEETIVEMKKWLAQQPHLPEISEDLMKKYLFGCKYNAEETKIRLTNYFAFRAKYPRLYANRDPCIEEHRKFRDVAYTATMPKMTKEGYRVIISMLESPDVDMYSPYDLIKHYHACADIYLRDETEISATGVIIVISGVHFSGAHVVKWDIATMKASTGLLNRCRPEAIKGIHFVDHNNIIKPFFTLITTFMSSKIKKRISYNDPDALFAQIPRDILPDEVGGSAGPLKKFSDHWCNYVNSNRDWLMTEGSKKANLDLMPKDNEHAVFQDTFRKLDLD